METLVYFQENPSTSKAHLLSLLTRHNLPSLPYNKSFSGRGWELSVNDSRAEQSTSKKENEGKTEGLSPDKIQNSCKN